MQGLNIFIVLLINLLFMTKQSCAQFTARTGADTKIDPDLLQQLQNGRNATLLVEFGDSVQNVTNSFENRTFNTMEDRQAALNQALNDFTEKSQKNVTQFLGKEPAARGITYQPLSLINLVIVRDGDLKLARELEQFDEVSKIRPDGQAGIFRK